MLDPFLSEALRRLDRWLLFICDEEERRAKLLAGDGSNGWGGVRNLVRPETERLAFFDKPKEYLLLPLGDHAMHRVGEALGLESCEREILLLLLAPYIEPRYSALYAVLHDDLKQTRPTERLVFTVLGRTPQRRRVLSDSLGPTGRLTASGFVAREPGSFPPLACPLMLPEDVLALLLGSEAPPVPGAQSQRWSARPVEAQAQPRQNAKSGDDVLSLQPTPPEGERELLLAGQSEMQPCLVIYGAGDRAGRARELARNSTTLEVRTPASLSDARRVSQAAWRIGLATGAVPLLDLADLDQGDALSVGRFVGGLVRSLGGQAWILGREPLPLPVPHVESQLPSWSQRREAWLREARDRGVGLDHDQASRLASRHRLQPGEIREVFDAAGAHDEHALDVTARQLGYANVAHSQRILPKRGFDDLVLRDTTRQGLERLVFYVLHRDRVAETRDLERRYQLQRGPIALFSGCSGTGKTLAAEAIAEALGRPLHTVDLARLVSKYIGDTEKHIDDVLSQAEHSSAVIFFDEADVLFSNRMENASNSSEHFANMVVGYLLQRIERHDGLVILATNLRHAIDEAFLRRFQFRIEFPLPDARERQRIWQLMLPDGVPRAADVDLGLVAQSQRLAGGEIRNAALRAIFLADSESTAVCQEHLQRAVALELLELGRLSRQPMESVIPDRGQLLRQCGDVLEQSIEDYLRPRFLKEIHIVHGSPTKETLGGRRPAVAITLFRLAAKRGENGVRLGFVISTWSHRAEEEYELLGVVHEALSVMSLTQVEGRPTKMRVQDSHDFDLLHRFWSSHEQPVRPAIVLDIEVD